MQADAEKRFADIWFGSEHKLPNRLWDRCDSWQEAERRQEAFLAGPIAEHIEAWAGKLAAWPKFTAEERKELYSKLVNLPDNAMAAASSSSKGCHHGWSYTDMESVRAFWLTPHAQQLLAVVAPHIACPHFFGDHLCKVFDFERPMGIWTWDRYLCDSREAASAAYTLGIKEIAEYKTAASRDWPWAGRVARIEALYQGLLEMGQGRMHDAGFMIVILLRRNWAEGPATKSF